MRWCPRCRQEFVATAARCADCDTPLVDELPLAEDAERTRTLPPMRVVAEAEWLDRIREALSRAGIPFDEGEDGASLSIPGQAAEGVAAGLARDLDVEVSEGELRVLGARRDPERALPADPAVLEESADELGRDPPRSVPRLAGLLVAESPRIRRRAFDRLVDLERGGAIALGEVAAWLAREGFRRPLFALAAFLAEEPGDRAPRLAQELRTMEPAALGLALHALARWGDARVARDVLPLLAHGDAEVRGEADEVLMSVSGLDMRFDADAGPAERDRAIQLWREWVEGRASD